MIVTLLLPFFTLNFPLKLELKKFKFGLLILFGLLSLLGLLLVIIPTSSNALSAGIDGAVDPTFQSGAGPNGLVTKAVIQPDGKILIGGNFTTYNNSSRNRLTRLNNDSSLDTTFNVGSGVDNLINTIALQSDGKILIGGSFTSYNGTNINRIARLNSDGSLDSTFTVGSGVTNTVNVITIQPDGKILIGGSFTSYNGTNINRIARLNADGSLDSTFTVGNGPNGTVYTIALQDDNKILIGGNFTIYNTTARNRIARLNSNGSLDTTFTVGSGFNSDVRNIIFQSSGKIVVSGFFSTYGGVSSPALIRLTTTGAIDNTFSSGLIATNSVIALLVQTDGKILIGGAFTSYSGTARNRLARLNSDGTLDTTFNPGSGPANTVLGIALQSDEKPLIAGSFLIYNGSSVNYLARLNTDGSLDTPFNAGGGADSTILAMEVQKDDKIVIGGSFTNYSSASRNRIARLNADGTLDSTFNPGSGANNTVEGVKLQSDGKILVGGVFTNYNGININRLARLNPDGSLDNTFNIGSGFDSDVASFALQNDGKILAGGFFNTYNGISSTKLIRLNPDGSRDNSFTMGSGAINSIASIVVQNDGKIVIGGFFTSYNGVNISRIARLNPDGSLDNTFNVGSGFNGSPFVLVLQPDGKILVGGGFTTYNDIERIRIARLNPDGSLDTGFPATGSTFDERVYTIALQSDGKILVGGIFSSYNNTPAGSLARLNADGTFDPTFNSGSGTPSFVYASGIQKDGRAIFGGSFNSIDTYTRNYIVRLENTVKAVSSTELTSSSNPASVGDSLTFTATVTPLTATGPVTFTFGAGEISVTGTLVNGVASYLTNTLPAGTYTVTATYAGDAAHFGSSSAVYTQVILPVCNPALVTSSTDNGQGSSCGTFSYALANVASGTISFALSSGNIITFSGALAPALKPGVEIDGGQNGTILNGNGVAGDGLRLGGVNKLSNLIVRRFAQRELVVTPNASANYLYRVKLES